MNIGLMLVAHYLSEDSLGGDQSLWDVQMGLLGLTSTVQSLREMGGKCFFFPSGAISKPSVS